MNDNKELNDNLERLFSTIKDAYGISTMINAIKEKEVVKSKDFKILSIIYYGNGCKNIVSEDDIVYIPPNYSILKVKRLSDNQEFEIGMETDEGKIKSFYISENILWVRTEEKGGVVSLNEIEKIKDRVPLFHDNFGNPIYEGDEYWFITDLEDGKVHKKIANYGSGKYDTFKYFSTEDKAKSFVLLNKTELSLKEVQDILLDFNNWDKAIGGNHINFEKVNAKLVILVNKKINNNVSN